MDSYGASIIADSRRADHVREAETERTVRAARSSDGTTAAEPRPATRRHHAGRPAIA